MSRFDSTIFRSRRRVAGATAVVAAGVVAAVATPILSSGGGVATAEIAKTTSGHHISYKADPHGIGGESVYVKPAAAKPAPKPAVTKTATTNGTERASRSSSRRSLPTTSSYSGSPKAIAQTMLAQRGWSGQFSCLNSLWNKESGWSVSASNPSGAYGIPQALPGSKMSSAGSDWQSNPATQIKWGLNYISSTYGSPCAAWSHSQANNWY